MKHVEPSGLLALAAFAALAACSGSSGGGGGPVGEVNTSGDFVVLNTTPTNGGRIYLNDAISIDFSTPVDLDSANLTTVSFQALDQQGIPNSELVSGSFQLATSPGDTAVGRRLQFVPRYATDNDYTNGGLRAGRTYLVQLVGGQAQNGTVLRDRNGRALRQPVTFRFGTTEGTQPAQLFRNPKSGGPTRTALEVSTATDLGNVPLNLFGAPPLEVRLHFDQALNPSDVNVPVNLDNNPLVRDESKRGRIYLEYENPAIGAGVYTWIPADVALEQNDLNGSVVALRPIGVLPNNATVRVIVKNTLEDISGESNVASFSYNEVFGTFKTDASYAPQWNGIAEDFATTDTIDFGAAFPEAQADVQDGFVRAGFAFEGNPTSLEYEPTASEVVLNTAFTQITPKSGLPFTVSGGVFNFKNVRIPSGVNVQGTGPNPMIWLCSGDFTVEGTLSVRGGNGARVDTLQAANFAKAGGIGVCGGGNGGDGTPSATLRDLRGGTGRGPLQVPGKGGRGGYLACTSGCYTGSGYDGSGGGSGGGGGTLSTQGDPSYRNIPPGTINPNVPPTANTRFQQVRGYGGAGCSGDSGSRTAFLTGGEPGDLVFTDSRVDNNFWGSGIRFGSAGSLRITGELSIPLGGGGGGGGGDTSPNFSCSLTSPDPKNDYSGGGGGGGGGVLIVKALGTITVTASGRIVADGGYGGGGEQAGACGEAGGGGAGAGGMIVLMSATEIVLYAHGSAAANRYAYGPTPGVPSVGQNDYDFSLSADGGVTTTGTFGSVLITSKYPASGSTMLSGTTYDLDPLGGFGGMGLVQLMVPPGDNSDGTNTRLDDKITLLKTLANGSVVAMTPAEKQALLAWRGFPNAAGQFVDDFNNPTGITDNEGDIRPSPVLLPVPFSAKSRLRSKWIDTGVSKRREIGAPDGLPAGIVGAPTGPTYEFAGIVPGTGAADANAGYVSYREVGASVAIDYPVVFGPVNLAGVAADASYLGVPAYRATLTGAALPVANRFVQYEAELLNTGGSVVGSFRIVSHTAGELLLDPGVGVLPTDAKQLRIVAKFFQIVTNGAEGLGPTYRRLSDNALFPNANVRIGFAFHQDPKSTDPTKRYPSDAQKFVYDLNEPGFLDWIAAPGNGAPRYVQYDVTFDLTYQNNSTAPSLSPTSPRPELHFLRLPFRF
ncbi:MAG: hypothetical protein JNM25_12200 [Planctomycetes bacterium]|nr:hypothetical protein [Planctomycetota bacterium]